jgi:hypothetical protein
MKSWRQLAGGCLVLMFLNSFSTALAAPSARLWEYWSAFDPESKATIDHAGWSDWLERFVIVNPDGVNRVAYADVTREDRAQLRHYIDRLAALRIGDYNRAQQLAYWINLYNALTVDIVLEHYPLDSIRDISSGLFSSGPWGLKLVTIEGKKLSLDDIEHRILRPIWQDPRIHYAVNCASLGCPNLQPLAFTAANSENLLQAAAREFINHPRGASVSNNRLRVSSIYHWFEADFGSNDAGVIAHLKQYATPDLSTALDAIDKISGHDYDWRINAQANLE